MARLVLRSAEGRNPRKGKDLKRIKNLLCIRETPLFVAGTRGLWQAQEV